MIDKLEVRVPANVPYSKEFSLLYQETRGDQKLDPFRPSRHYLQVGDLRGLRFSAILHAHCKHGRVGNHKIE